MSYEFYKVIHILCLITIGSCVGMGFFVRPPMKWSKILGGLMSLFLLVSGMGLLARIGGKFEPWVIGKLVIWLILAISVPVLGKRLQKKQVLAYSGVLALFTVAIYLAVNKPGI